MEVSFLAAVNVSILAMAVIFIVLTILIFTIQTLVKLIPYEAPTSLPSKQKTISSVSSEQDDHVAAITATLAMHMGKSPKEFKIVSIS